MNEDAYNYRIFEFHTREFEEFSTHAPMATMRAPSFPLEHLDIPRGNESSLGREDARPPSCIPSAGYQHRSAA